MRALVDLVEIGPLLAIDLDVDEEAVHHLRDRRILEALVRHHMAPVARRVADGKEDRPVLAPGALQGFRSPRVPVDRILGVLLQVGRGLGGEAVGHCRRQSKTPARGGGWQAAAALSARAA